MKKLLVFLIVFSFCTSENTEPLEEEVVETIKSETEETIEVTTTSIQVTQLETFDKEVYKVNSELSSVSYLAPKQFLNANLEIVEGVTNQISGEFKLTLSDCDSADSCLQVEDLAITADLSTLKSGSSIIDETIVGLLKIRDTEVNVPFSITAYMEDEVIYVSGITEVDTTWFGFDAPTKFGAWEVLNPIGIKISIVAEK